jgi:GSCFA family
MWQFLGKNPTHGNAAYGDLIFRHVVKHATDSPVPKPTATSDKRPAGSAHPYIGLPDRSFWKQAVSQVPFQQFDPVGEVPFRIMRSDKVATAGSCFAQHISKRIRSAGFQFMLMETPAGGLPGDGEKRGFQDFSARYGNIYTARQLVQLFDRAFGFYTPLDSHWEIQGNRFCDPFRPRIEPDGFPSIEALEEDRERHLAAVREMFKQLDVMVFTLGLTECWVSRLDGAAYPLAPGVAGGRFDPARYEFKNFGVDEVVADLQSFLQRLRLVNPKAKLLLTVSPVPLAATYEPQHVLISTTLSKSVLRVAAEVVSVSCRDVYYFPSFEIITGNYNRGRYFGPDLRAVTEEGVDHVMSVFMRHLTEGGDSSTTPGDRTDEKPAADDSTNEMMALAEADCDEELLERK